MLRTTLCFVEPALGRLTHGIRRNVPRNDPHDRPDALRNILRHYACCKRPMTTTIPTTFTTLQQQSNKHRSKDQTSNSKASKRLLPHYQPILGRKSYTSSSADMASATSFYDFKPFDKKGEPYPLAELKGKVVLVVNTASKCGFTPQFAGLEALYKDLKAKHPTDFEIIGFPCNQFGGQDPGSNDEIQQFCQLNYGVSFPVLGKIDVNGNSAAPVYEWMKKEKPGLLGMKLIKWNFEKFLIGADGKVKQRWASTTKPEALKTAIEEELAKLEKPAA